MITPEQQRELSKDSDGLTTYEYLANNIGEIDDDLPALVDNMLNVDATGQFTVSAARYLAAIDAEHFDVAIDRLVKGAIDKDRERRYIGDLLPALWGSDFEQRAEILKRSDDNFRRIYKRVNAADPI